MPLYTLYTMSDNTTPFSHPSFPVSLSSTSETAIPIVPVQKRLSSQEIERMFKAFIRLISAPEEETFVTKPRHAKHQPGSAAPARQSSHLPQGSHNRRTSPNAPDTNK